MLRIQSLNRSTRRTTSGQGLTVALHNLPADIRQSIQDDIDVVVKRAPALRLCVIALECGHLPGDMPRHDVELPGRAPEKFSERCAWETIRQSFQFVRERDTIWIIAGGTEGAIYGVDELLECLTGVIWAGVREDQILFGPIRSLPRGVQKPSFAYRVRDGNGPDEFARADYVRWLSRTRHNARVHSSTQWAGYSPAKRAELRRLYRSRGMHFVQGYHAMEYFLPEEKFAQHPEWFGMRGGKRARKGYMTIPEAQHLNAHVAIQPCYSNPSLIEYLSDRMAEYVRQFPEVEIFSVWPHDGINNWCQCPQCVQQSPFELIYRLADAVSKKTPARIPIEVIAYANTLTLPLQELPHNDRIISMLCPYLRQYRHRVFDKGGPKLVMGTLYPEPDRVNPIDDRDYGKLFRLWNPVWQQAGNTTGIFEYGGNQWFDESFSHERQRYLHHPRNAVRFAEARWYARHGVPYIYMCSSFKAWPDLVHTLGAARAVWNCRESAEEFDRCYYAAIAGNRGEALRKALNRVDEVLRADESPNAALEAVERVLAKMAPSKRVEQYRLWCQYVRLAWGSHREEKEGRLNAALASEKKLLAFSRKIARQTRHSASTRRMLNYSEIRQTRLRAKIDGTICTDYRL